MMKGYKTYTNLIIISLMIMFSSCGSNRLDVDISDIETDLKVNRMEQEIFSADPNNIKTIHSELLLKHGFLYQAFFESMIQEGPVKDARAHIYLEQFVSNPEMQKIYKEINSKFSDFSEFESQFEEAFSYYQYYFPDSTLPEITTFYSNFNSNVFPTEYTLGIGLDMYMGTNSEIVKSLPPEQIPQFIKNKMDAKYMVADGMKYWLLNRFAEDIGDDFLSECIALGKIMYLLDAMMPFTEDYIKMGYTQEELEWCKTNELNIWTTIVDQDILYDKNQALVMQFISDGPFTKGLPEESPSRVGVWLGWQMVRDYVEENDLDVLDLLQEKNARKILKSYNPDE